MNTAMRLLFSLGAIYQEEAISGEEGGNASTDMVFAPEQHSSLYTEPEERDLEDGSGDDEEDEGDTTKAGEEGEGEDSGHDGNESQSEESGDDKLYFEGEEVEIQNDPEVERILGENGFDINSLNKEYYSKDGLKQETVAKLEEAFGKPTVSLYLKSLEATNKAYIAERNASSTTFEVQQSQMASLATEGNLEAVLKWANNTMEPEQYKRYATIVNGENLEAAEMALENMYMQYKTANPAQEQQGSGRPNLVTDAGSTGQESDPNTVGLSADEYADLFIPTPQNPRGEYFNNPSKYDQLRELGRKRGR